MRVKLETLVKKAGDKIWLYREKEKFQGVIKLDEDGEPYVVREGQFCSIGRGQRVGYKDKLGRHMIYDVI